jgi:acetolactate synthase-1/2/3 large subunit
MVFLLENDALAKVKKISADKMRTGAQALVESLECAGAEIVFGYPGGNVVDIFDSLRTSSLQFVLGRHEQGSVHMADGYARSSGKVGVVLVTSGPGLTNAITGLGTANIDGIPLVLVCGQVPLDQIGTDAFQESDTTGLTRAVTKHNFLVKSADEIPQTVAEAFHIATHGKCGAVVIDIPKDVQEELTSSVYPEKVVLRAYHPEREVSLKDVERVARLLNSAERPLIYAGGGVISSEASQFVVSIARKGGIPIATTMMGIGVAGGAEDLSLGMSGVHGTKAANEAMASADLVLALGVRFNDRATGGGGFFPSPEGRRIVHIDCDASSIAKNVPVYMGVVCDINDFASALPPLVKSSERKKWLKKLRSLKEKEKLVKSSSSDGKISPLTVVEHIRRHMEKECVVVTDVGQHQLWAVRGLGDIRARSFIAPGGMGTMGFAIPAAIGSSLARPDSRVVALVGDGGAQMTFEELIVAAELGLKILFVVFENRTLGLVRQMQLSKRRGLPFATEMRCPDFVKIAKACGIEGEKVSCAAELEKAFSRAFKSQKSVLIEVHVDAEADV